jgi:nicotinate-nucleotide adenylyltransferase
MKLLYKKFPRHQFRFMIGYDIVPELKSWYNYFWLKKNVHFLIITRTTDRNISDEIDIDHYQLLHILPIDISSTQIRDRVKNQQPLDQLVPQQIIDDIIKLYS